jgi:hypothetical protein
MLRVSEDLLSLLGASTLFPHLGQKRPCAGIWDEQDEQILNRFIV